MAYAQAERAEARPGRATCSAAGSVMERQTGEPAFAQLVGMGRHSAVYTETGLDHFAAEDDGARGKVSRDSRSAGHGNSTRAHSCGFRFVPRKADPRLRISGSIGPDDKTAPALGH